MFSFKTEHQNAVRKQCCEMTKTDLDDHAQNNKAGLYPCTIQKSILNSCHLVYYVYVYPCTTGKFDLVSMVI